MLTVSKLAVVELMWWVVGNVARLLPLVVELSVGADAKLDQEVWKLLHNSPNDQLA